jgi:hypothetical protein
MVSGGHDPDGYHEMVFKLGRNTERLENLNRLFEQHCEDDDRRHVENVELLKANNEAIKDLAQALAPIAANYKLTKRRLALVASMGLAVLIGLSWAVEAGLKWAIGWLLKVKFGG